MKIAVVGAGGVGGELGRIWSQLGHTVVFGTRDAQSEKVKKTLAACKGKATAAPSEDAVQQSDVVLVSLPWDATKSVVRKLNLAGKTVIDATNPIGEGLQLAVGAFTSGGEEVQKWAKGAHVVKCFNTVGFNMYARPEFKDGSVADMYYCGDDARSKDIVKDLVKSMGFTPIDCGGLQSARFTEPLAMLWITLAYKQNMGREMAFKLLH